MFPTVVAEAFYGNMDIMFIPTATIIPIISMPAIFTPQAEVAVAVDFRAAVAPVLALVRVPAADGRDAVKRMATA